MLAPKMKSRSFIGVLVALIGLLILAPLVVLFTPWITDGLLWRFERFAPRPALSQRILERQEHNNDLWQDRFIPAGSVLLFGDSHFQSLPRVGLAGMYNFAINGQSVGRMIDRVPQFSSVPVAALIFIVGGENDLAEGTSVKDVETHWVKLLSRLSKKSNVVCVGLPETNGQRMHADAVPTLNQAIERICNASGAEYMSVRMGVGIFLNQELSEDHVHLSIPGMKIFSNELLRRANIARKLV